MKKKLAFQKVLELEPFDNVVKIYTLLASSKQTTPTDMNIVV